MVWANWLPLTATCRLCSIKSSLVCTPFFILDFCGSGTVFFNIWGCVLLVSFLVFLWCCCDCVLLEDDIEDVNNALWTFFFLVLLFSSLIWDLLWDEADDCWLWVVKLPPFLLFDVLSLWFWLTSLMDGALLAALAKNALLVSMRSYITEKKNLHCIP